MSKYLLATLLLLLSAPLAAEEDYKTPANMSPEDRRDLMAASDAYESCVREELNERAADIDDPRALADAAMAACSKMLTTMAEEMAADNYHPDFSNYYIGKVKNRVANDAVRQAMVFASQKQSQSAE
ncbi:hypothetical protein J2T55_001058 [Methylohalomonas lacus]|uniref:Uncharacterized protein n=1 Tax=Methylohalomonas lacus TaxID=398773 RepID=A0AAE3L1D8_9GAMM|nr:hypothetical protein [Methylohalomonas lacus]MCS3903041.1 hypothetical protein [Methylohalomonas lacus]